MGGRLKMTEKTYLVDYDTIHDSTVRTDKITACNAHKAAEMVQDLSGGVKIVLNVTIDKG